MFQRSLTQHVLAPTPVLRRPCPFMPIVRRNCIIAATASPDGNAETESSSHKPSTSGKQRELQKVPISELPGRPNPKAMKTLNRSQTKSGVNKLLVDNLSGTSFTIVGDDSDLNWAVAQSLANRIGWFATATRKVVAGMSGCSVEDLKHKSHEALAAAELSVLRGLRTQRRVVVATLANGAAAKKDTYTDLWGSFIIRVDEEDKAALKPVTPERACHAELAEIELKIWRNKGFATMRSTPDQKAKENESVLVELIIGYMNSNIGTNGEMGIVEKKAQYINLGCRGDWPHLQPADWKPVLEVLDRKPLPEA